MKNYNHTNTALIQGSRIVILLILLICPPVATVQSLDLANNSLGDFFTHAVTSLNKTGHLTYIDHALTNNNPNAIVMVTQNWNPDGIGGTYNDHSIGVWYSSSQGKWSIFNQDFVEMPDGTAFNVLVPSTEAIAFVHTAISSNSAGNVTYIDHALTNNNPDAIVMVTQNWNPGGIGGTYNDHSIGVWYSSSQGKWSIFNQDIADMPEGAAFNVLLPGSASATFVHAATSSNIVSNWTLIDHPSTNNNPNAIVTVTQNWNPGGVGGTYNDHSIGVWYSHSQGKWSIFNQDIAAMPEGASFNVSILRTKTEGLVHTTTSANSAGNVTYIDHASTNNNPDAIVMVMQNWNPGGVGGTYSDHSIGVWYNGSKWSIFNQDIAEMPEGAAFNVLIPGSASATFVHTATSSNITSNWTVIDHPSTNNNPDAIVMATQNWNPGGVGGTYNDHSIGVWYNGSRWAIFNQDLAAMPEAAAFNVLILRSEFDILVHTSTSSNIISNWTLIDHPSTNNNPNAFVMVTQNWNPGGVGGTYNDHSIGVWYDGIRWAIFNQDLAAMTEDAAFNILVFGALPTVIVEGQEMTPTEFHLAQNYPNPFNTTTTIQFILPKPSFVILKIFDILGREVAILIDKKMQPGEYKLNFDAQGLPSGLYFYQLKTEEFVGLKKFILLK